MLGSYDVTASTRVASAAARRRPAKEFVEGEVGAMSRSSAATCPRTRTPRREAGNARTGAEQGAVSRTAWRLPHTTTANTARDMDRIRAALVNRCVTPPAGD
ncbi:hypothetical protein GCM10017744_008630 [Streptomyces antimycoticus]|uniref:Uncharacterized protein n=1 Tax=Streptomyces antimycoticus TaxID=68175 RepID=A0A4D4KQX3_9ACTN|nr:hypothetical protein SANT12839_091510 [Streptomyces antimycoticus]